MKILVTGGTVFLSKFIAEYFVNRGDEVFVLNRNSRPQIYGVHLIESDRHCVQNKLKNYVFDVVIDVTAYTAQDINLLLDGLGEFKNYVFISSSAVYPETLKIPFKESDKCGKNKFWGDYGLNKIAAENALTKRVGGAYILRPPYLYGEYNNVYREGFVFDCAERNMSFYLPEDGSMPLQFFHVEDLCKFIEKLLKIKPEQKIYNVGNAPVTVKKWVESCYAVLSKTPQFISVSNVDQRKYFPFSDYGYVLDTTAQNNLLKDLLPLCSGLSRAYKWYKYNKSQVNSKPYLKFIENNL